MSNSKELAVIETSGIVKAASEENLNGLHQVIAQYLTMQVVGLKKGEKLEDKTIDQILKFLKDNDIKADVTYSKPLGKLKDAIEPPENAVSKVDDLPFNTEDEDEDEENL